MKRAANQDAVSRLGWLFLLHWRSFFWFMVGLMVGMHLCFFLLMLKHR